MIFSKRTILVSLVGSILFAPHALSDDSQPAEEIVKEYYLRFQKPGFLVDDLMNFYAEDVLFKDPTFEIVAEGKDEVRRLYENIGTDRTAYKDIHWKISDVIIQDNSIVIRGKWSGRFSNCEFEIDFMTFWRMRDGKIAEQDDFFAASSFDRQVGWNGTVAQCKS